MSAPELFLDGRVALWRGDVREMLAAMEPDSVDCVVTSPPYWGLRDYGVAGQIGLEPTLGEHLDVMVEVFRLVRRVLKPSGTCWVNYGDCYATSPNGRSAADVKAAGKDDRTFRDKPFSTIGAIRARSNVGEGQHHDRHGGVLKPKDLCMVPNRLAIALQDDGWWVRSEIVWAKPNPMPESIRDRPATAHEKVFLLTKSERYWYDAMAVRQGASPASLQRWAQDIENQEGSYRANGGRKTNGTMKAVGGRRAKQAETAAAAAAVGASSGRRMAGFNERWDGAEKKRASDVADPRHAGHINHTGIEGVERGSRNLRNYEPAPLTVWPVATKPFGEAHFATFPPELAERCILAGCPRGSLVLDPFGGAGTTAMVALRHGRRAALIELNQDYAGMARRRIERDWMGPEQRALAKAPVAVNAGPLFELPGAAE
ncbi:DNA-methyltransferase [Roseixanthobacter glucoisosaccharinicivorans]|uniref:DNA-methyltransferase n=1 Tax=Roseixanthobacter glucoisosaccharinicivorans TaxID=3119923 RepID=UPI0037280F7E